jgi:hypothetical protein
MRTSRIGIFLLGMILLLAACAGVAPTPSQSAAPNLGGTSWQLVKFQGSDDKTLTPDDKTKYTIQFNTDGVLSARIDCNRGRGTWKSSGASQLQLGPLALALPIGIFINSPGKGRPAGFDFSIRASSRNNAPRPRLFSKPEIRFPIERVERVSLNFMKNRTP